MLRSPSTSALTLNNGTYGELSTQTVTASGAPLMQFQYNATSMPRDLLGRIRQKLETYGGVTKEIRYTYDVLGRLTDVTIDGALSEHYEYDLNGNRLFAETPEGVVAGTYDAQDRLLSYGALEYTYGANGELFTKTDTSTDETTAYTYDAFGSLIAVELPDGRLIEYVTDGKHRRVGKKVDGVLVKQWLYRDQLNPVAELDGAGNLVARFVYGSRGHVPDFVVRGGAVYRIVSDQIGSVRLVVNVDDVSDVLFRAEYSAFGEMTVLDGDVEAAGFGFAGGLFDADTGLTRFGARDYDPHVGRWTAKDPIRLLDGYNLYVYVGCDPVNAHDPFGLFRWPWEIKDDATRQAQESGLLGPRNGPQDAFRHCLASCMATQEYGEYGAAALGLANEHAGDIFGQPQEERAMDDFNNICGMHFGNAGGDCAESCMAAVNDGGLITSPGPESGYIPVF